MPSPPRYKPPTLSFLRHLLPLSAALLLLYLLLSPTPTLTPLTATPSPTSPRHLVFGIASSASSFPRRHSYLRLWYRPNLTRAHIFLDTLPPSPSSPDLPPLHLSSPTARFPYTFTGGHASAVRVARIVSDLIPLSPPDTRWIVLGDDDTLFFPENLAATLGKYDWEQWWYVGGRSESVEQNVKYSFEMAFGGGGIAISYPLAKVLAGVLDSCLMRYGHLYGSDARIFACLTELGVGLTYEPGFHQVDIRGNLFGMLSAHPLSRLVSLHHLDYVEPLFPGMNRLAAARHLFEAVNVDPGRILQQIVCYDHAKSRTMSVSWGYAVQVFEGNMLLPDILSSQKTFTPWKRGRNISSSLYMFNTREFPRDPCKRPVVFFLESVISDKNRIAINYSRYISGNCPSLKSSKNLRQIRVYSQKLNMEIGQVQRRHCCDVLPSSSETFLEINVKKCKDNELIAMHL